MQIHHSSKNFLNEKASTIQDYCNAFRKITWKKIWGIDVNCNSRLPDISWMHYELLRYQQLNDCCEECNISNTPQNAVIYQTASLNSSQQFPFVALSICNPTTGCKNTQQGDFNSDFNHDFFIY